MPTEEHILANIFKAVLSVSGATLEKFTLHPNRTAYRFNLEHPIVLDSQHAKILAPYLDSPIREEYE